ncbi:MAG: maleylpyruvate isomerase family mycothiol-dependent enzyme [Actinomycetota bacterium]
MTTAKEPLTELLSMQFESLDDLGSELSIPEWYAKSSLPGWAVLDVYSHIIGTESMLEGEELPNVPVDVSALGHVHNDVGQFNEAWIEALADLDPPALLDRYRSITKQRLASLQAMDPAEFEAETLTPIGPAPYWRFMQIRVFDCWMHEQDVREATGHSGHEAGPCAEASVDEVERALGYIVGKKAKLSDGTGLTIQLTGPVERTIHVLVDGRAGVVPALPGPPSAKISMTSSLFMRLVGGRTDFLSSRLGEMDFAGDLGVAQKVVTNLPFTI